MEMKEVASHISAICYRLEMLERYLPKLALPEQTLSFAEVVKGLKEGKRFRRADWICSIKKHIDTSYIENDLRGSATFQIEDFEATDWVEVRPFVIEREKLS